MCVQMGYSGAYVDPEHKDGDMFYFYCSRYGKTWDEYINMQESLDEN